VAEVAVPRVLEREAIEDAPVAPHQRKRIEQTDGAGMPVEQLSEIRFAQPAIEAMARLDADDVGYDGGTVEPSRQVHLAEAADAEQSFDLVLEARFGAPYDFRRRKVRRLAIRRARRGSDEARRRLRGRLHGSEVGRHRHHQWERPPAYRLRAIAHE